MQNEKNVINQVDGVDGYIVDVVELMGEKQKYGNGTDGKKDVYKIEEEVPQTAKLQKVASTNNLQLAKEETKNKIYDVYYCADEDNKLLLGTLNEQSSSSNEETIENLDMFVINYRPYYDEFHLEWEAFEHFYSNKIDDRINEKLEELNELTDEEIIIYDTNLESSQNFETFKEAVDYWITDGWLENEVTNAEEFFKETSTDRQDWLGYIEVYYENSSNWTFLNEKGEEIGNHNSPKITGKGEYIYTVKTGEIEQKFKITIDKYELVTYNEINIGIYDFEENKWLSVKSGTWKEIGENKTEEEILEENILIDCIENGINLVSREQFSYYKDYELNLVSSNGLTVKGFAYFYQVPE